jgi:hypothetical protein
MRMIKKLFAKGFALPAIVLCSLSLPVSAAQAALVTYSFTGTVGSASGALRSDMPVGSTMSGTFSFENGTPASAPGRYPDAVQSLKLTFGSYDVELDPAGDMNVIRIVNNPSGDLWRLRTSVMPDATDGPIGVFTPVDFRLDLEDEDGLAINSTSLQDPPSLGSLTSTQWRLVFEDAGGRMVRVQGVLNSLTAVPLPAAVLLFGAGLISLVGLGAGGLRNLRGSRA